MSRGGLARFLTWRLIGPVVVVAAIWWAGPMQVWAVLSGADLALVAAALGLAIPFALIKGLRWRALLRGYQIRLGFGESTGMYAMGMTMAAVTPGHLGDFIKALSLIRRGYGIAQAIASNVFDRLLDVAFVLLAGYGGMCFFSQYFSSQLRMLNVIAAALLVGGVIAVSRRRVLKKFVAKLVPAQYRPVVQQSWNEVVSGILCQGVVGSIQLAGLTVVFWMAQFLAAYLCSMALGLSVSFLYLAACLAVVTVASFVPITVAGVGVRDAILVLLLGQIGIARQESLALSSLILAVFVGNCIVFYVISVLTTPRTSPVGDGRQARSRRDACPPKLPRQTKR